eukprot:COSAG04_NODE_5226_length_1695_cov_1.250627_1_plen_107_part_00
MDDFELNGGTDQANYGNYDVWRIDDGPVYGIPWEVCQAAMQRSLWSEQQGFPPSWPSQDPSSCANESYYPFTTYSTTEMLTAGDHTLWNGAVMMTSYQASFMGWIK